MTNEYWKWPESSWVAEESAWKAGGAVTAGIDLGTTSAQAAVMRGNELLGYANIRVMTDFSETSAAALDLAIKNADIKIKDIAAIGGTGFAKKNISYATKTLDEVQCHAKGARFMFGPDVRTVADLGGQTVKAIRLFDWDRVRDFMIGDKCATGEGRRIEVLCDLMHTGITEIGPKSLEAEKDPEPVSTTCWAFAGTETLGLFGRPEFRSEKLSEAEIYASYLFSVAWRIIGVIGRLSSLEAGEVEIDGVLGLTGGLAKNPGITKRIERELGVKAAVSEYDPMLAGAIGAALLVQ